MDGDLLGVLLLIDGDLLPPKDIFIDGELLVEPLLLF